MLRISSETSKYIKSNNHGVESQVTSKKRGVNNEDWDGPYLNLNDVDASPHVQDTVTIYTDRPAGYVEFNVTEAMDNWMNGEPNYGLLVLATNENIDGRELQFFSKDMPDPGCEYHPFVNVVCDY